MVIDISDFMIRKEELPKSILLEGRLNEEISLTTILEQRLKEADELSEIFLRDKEEADEKYENLKLKADSYGKFVKIFSGLPKIERELLCKFLPKQKSERSINEKIVYQRIHNDPRGFRLFLDKIASCEYVHEIHGGRQTGRNAKKTDFYKVYRNNKIWKIEGLYTTDNFGKIVYVSTTAKNEMEAIYIENLLNSLFK